jgi:hypothetical protein
MKNFFDRAISVAVVAFMLVVQFHCGGVSRAEGPPVTKIEQVSCAFCVEGSIPGFNFGGGKLDCPRCGGSTMVQVERLYFMPNESEVFVTFEADPLPPPKVDPKAIYIAPDELAAMIDAAVQKAMDKRFGPVPGATTGGCGAAVSVDATGCSASASTGRGRLFGGNGLFSRIRAWRANRGTAGGC